METTGDDHDHRDHRRGAASVTPSARLLIATRGNFEEIPRSDLEFQRYQIVHVPSGRLFHRVRGEVSLVITTS